MYKLDPHGDTIEENFRAIALSQLDEVLAVLERGDAGSRSLVHEARRRCKKLRGLLRLVRPAFPDFARENGAIRDAAQLLSPLRDAEVLDQTLVQLGADRPDLTFERTRRHLASHRLAIDARDGLEAFRERLVALRNRAAGWTLSRDGEDAVIPGLRRTYRAARRRMRHAERTRLASALHGWRKASKDHGFHLDLLKRLAPDLLEHGADIVERLATLLGRHRDLTLLGEALDESPSDFGTDEELDVLRRAIAAGKAEADDAAFALGRQIFAEKPRAVARRFETYWNTAP